MSQIKCLECGLVNWPDAVECKRCQALLTVQEISAQQSHYDTPEPKRVFSGVITFLTATLALATVAVLLARVFQLIDGDAAKILAAIFILVGVSFYILTGLCLTVRIFEQSVWWGLGTLFLPFVGMIALILFWEKTKRSFLGQMICMGIMLAGYFIMPATFRAESASQY
jgi:hypothetical protein